MTPHLLTAVCSALVAVAALAWPRSPVAEPRLVLPADARARDDRADGEASPAGAPLATDLVMELVACGLRAGLSVPDALAAAAPGAPGDYLATVVGRTRLGVPMDQAVARPPPDYERLTRALVLAELSGAPTAAVVSRAAADLRAERREAAEAAAARLGVRLVLPLGLAVLPGFVLLAVVPIVLGLLTSVLAGTA